MTELERARQELDEFKRKYIYYAEGSFHWTSFREVLAEFERLALAALDKYLPEGYAIGDDATAELAVKLARAESELEDARHALRVIRVSTQVRHARKIAEAALSEKVSES